MFLDSIGIILKKDTSSQYKISIFDKIQGKIDCIVPAEFFSIGALITYTAKQDKSHYIMSDSKLVYIPFSLAKSDILFFHHVLELIYYFSASNSCSKKTFDLLQFLYITQHETMTMQCKKIFLLKLLISTESLECDVRYWALIKKCTQFTLDQLNEIQLSIAEEKELDTYLWYCVYQHPYVNTFKTTTFLSKNRIL